MGKRETVRLPHVDQSGRGLDDGECSYCGDAGNLESTECHVRLRQALDDAERRATRGLTVKQERYVRASRERLALDSDDAAIVLVEAATALLGEEVPDAIEQAQGEAERLRGENEALRVDRSAGLECELRLQAALATAQHAAEDAAAERDALRAWVREARKAVAIAAQVVDQKGYHAQARSLLALRDAGRALLGEEVPDAGT